MVRNCRPSVWPISKTRQTLGWETWRAMNFTMETRYGRTVLHDGFRQEFQRHRLAELEAFGAIDFAHGAASGHGHDVVAVLEDRARSESHAVRSIRRCCGHC
jgi:hypothetical protein